MGFLIILLTILEIIVCLLLSLLVLMQRPRQEGLGAAFGSGVTDQMFGAQTTNVLQKGTVYLGATLFALTFLLAILVARQDDRSKETSTFVEPTDKVVQPTPPPAPAQPAKDAPTPAKPAQGTSEAPKTTAPAAPAAPATKPAASPPTAPAPAPAPAPASATPPRLPPAPAK